MAKRKSTLIDQLQQLIKRHQAKGNTIFSTNAWLRGDGLEVYIRLTQRINPAGRAKRLRTLEIANVSATKPGKGSFTRFLEEVERISPYTIYIENVLDARFRGFFERRDYKEWPFPPGRVPCYYKELTRS